MYAQEAGGKGCENSGTEHNDNVREEYVLKPCESRQARCHSDQSPGKRSTAKGDPHAREIELAVNNGHARVDNPLSCRLFNRRKSKHCCKQLPHPDPPENRRPSIHAITTFSLTDHAHGIAYAI